MASNSNVWSCSRYNANNGWYANGNNGYANNNNLYNSYLAVPLVNYDCRKMDIDTIIEDYLQNRANKRRSKDSVHFELHWERDLVRLLDDVNDRSLDPLIYSFVRTRPRPREVIAGLMQMKIIQQHFDNAVRPLVEKELTDRTFNNRIGLGVDKAIERIVDDIREVSHNYTRDCWIISRDIHAYFPSTDLDRSYNKYRALIEENIPESEDRDDLLYILMRVNYAYPQIHTVLVSPRAAYDDIVMSDKSVVFNNDLSRGACLGNQFWQVQKNYDLAEYDKWQVETCGMHYVRFVDDETWIVDNLEMGLAHISLSEKKLAEEGYVMHPNKRYCQHFSKGVAVLGVHIKYDRVYTDYRTIRNCRMAIRRWNRLVYPSQLEHFLSSINSYLGLMKHRTNYGVIRDMVDEVSPKWLAYCHYNDDRRCFVANEGYRHKDLLKRKYHFKFHKDKIKNNEKTGN